MIGRIVGRCRSATGAAWSGCTPGQRWTASLAIAVALLVLVFGMSPELPPLLRSPAFATGAVAGAAPPTARSAAPTAHAAPAQPLSTSTSAFDAAVPAAPDRVTPRQPRFVALVHQGVADAAGRDDAAIARAFVARSGLAVTVVTDEGSPAEVCARVRAAGDVVLAGTGAAPAVTDCLVGQGEVVVAFDPHGDRAPGSGGGQVVSTRRGVRDSLLDTARWGHSSGALAGRVGIAASRSLQPDVEASIAAMKAAGVDVVAQRYVDTSQTADDGRDVSDGVLAFAGTGVDVVLFALPVAYQSRWVALSKTVASATRFVTTDAEDAIVEETYPAVFDGALAFTTMRVPWFERAHGETAEEAACRSQWEGDNLKLLPGAETVSVFAWCEQISLAVAAERAPRGTGDFGSTIRSLHLGSPLTSDLGPLRGGGFGPVADAVLQWSASCSCWTEKTAFAARD